MDTTSEFLFPEEIARRLGVRRMVLENWIDRGYLPTVRYGHSVRISWSAVLEFLRRRSDNDFRRAARDRVLAATS